MSSLQPVRGTHDILPEEMRKHRRVIDTARAVAERYGYLEAQTPIFEFSDVFKRTLGDTSDIVTKEMYSFTDRGGETADPAAGRHGELRPRADLRRAEPGSAAEVFLPAARCSAMSGRRRAACASSTRPASSCWAWRSRRAMWRSLPSVLRSCARSALSTATVLELNTLGDNESRQELPQGAGRLSRRSQDQAVARTAWTGWSAIRCACSIRRTRAIRKIVANAPLYSDHLNEASRDFFDA